MRESWGGNAQTWETDQQEGQRMIQKGSNAEALHWLGGHGAQEQSEEGQKVGGKHINCFMERDFISQKQS